jgi:hypothetical protein
VLQDQHVEQQQQQQQQEQVETEQPQQQQQQQQQAAIKKRPSLLAEEEASKRHHGPFATGVSAGAPARFCDGLAEASPFAIGQPLDSLGAACACMGAGVFSAAHAGTPSGLPGPGLHSSSPGPASAGPFGSIVGNGCAATGSAGALQALARQLSLSLAAAAAGTAARAGSVSPSRGGEAPHEVLERIARERSLSSSGHLCVVASSGAEGRSDW